MHYIGAYDIFNPTLNGDASSSGVIPLADESTNDVLGSFVHTLSIIHSCI